MTARGKPFTSKTGREGGKKGGKISKRLPLDVEWRNKLYAIQKEGTKNTTGLNKIYDILMRNAEAGNMKAIEILFDRTFGNKSTIELTGKDGESINTQTIIHVSPIKSKTKK